MTCIPFADHYYVKVHCVLETVYTDSFKIYFICERSQSQDKENIHTFHVITQVADIRISIGFGISYDESVPVIGGSQGGAVRHWVQFSCCFGE